MRAPPVQRRYRAHQENYTSTYITLVTSTSVEVMKVNSSGHLTVTWLSRLLPYKVDFT